ncbi:MAG: ACP phosphodiesterase [Bacteroidota bacterium]
MNYLAHLYLSADHPKLSIGNFIADHVKGREIERYSGDILEGIRLHRHIDAFTDAHPVVEESKKRLRTVYGKYASVIADVYFDHFLARDWAMYHHQSLSDFARSSYSLMNTNRHHLPERTVYMLSYMESQNWLLSYASIDGIEKAFRGLSKRTRFDSGMEHAHQFLREYDQEFEGEFRRFFPELQETCKGFKSAVRSEK